jgi:hypothetical protein
MKKIILVFSFIFISIFCQSNISYAVTVSDLYPAAAVIDATTGGVNVPALVSVVGAGGAMVSTAVDLALTSTTVGVLAGVIGAAGLAYGGAMLYNYYTNTNQAYTIQGGQLMFTTTTYGWPSCIGTQGTNQFVTNSATYDAAVAAVNAAGAAYIAAHGGTSYYQGTWTTSCGVQVVNTLVSNCPAPGCYFRFFASVDGTSSNIPPTNTTNPATAAQIGNTLAAGLVAHEVNAGVAALNVVTQAATVFPNRDPVSGASKLSSAPLQTQADIKAWLNAGITSSQTTAANTAGGATTADQNAANIINAANAPMTADQFAAALKAAGLTSTALNTPTVWTNDQIAAATTAAIPAGVSLSSSQIGQINEAVAVAQANSATPLTAAQLATAVTAAVASVAAGYVPQSQLNTLVGAAIIAVVPVTVKPADIAAAITAAAIAKGLTLTPAQVANATAAVTATVSKDGTTTPDRITAAATAAVVVAADPTKTAADVTNATTAAVATVAAPGQLTQAQVQAAVAAALAAAVTPLNAYNAPTAPLAFALPVVGDFAGLFSNFLTTMKSSSLFSLPGLLSSSVPSGGECSWAVDMSSRFGGSQNISICNWSTGLSAIKAVLLCIASIGAVGIIAKGGGA